MAETEEHRCGLCGAPKTVLKEYNATPFGVKMNTVRLCQRCDLTPDAPVARDKGVG